ncbi:MAG: hypothetical protein J6Y78_18270 [Paludibacteraceae bacterium]|nr:hypothetical protein [Paludibacteraceae bacterium]
MQSLRADQSSYNRKGVSYISLFNGLWQVYSHSGNNGERKFTTILEINSKTPDENLNHVTENAIDTSQKTSQKAIFDLPTASPTSPYRLLSETFLKDCAFRLILSKFHLRHISDKRCIG